MLRQPRGFADWFAYGYLVLAAIVFSVLVTILLIGPW